MLLLAVNFPALGEEPPEGFSSWDEYYEYLIYGETVTDEVTNIDEMTLIGSNSRFDMYYNEGGADIYLKEKSTDKIWGSAVYGDYIDTKELSPNAISNLFVIVENYPDLKANTNFIQLQDELAGTENRIAVARKDYNDAVKDYNKEIKLFPKNILA